MSWTVTTHTAAPPGHHGYAHTETFPHRADAERYAREARNEGATTTVTGQHHAEPVTIERARQWMTHTAGIWASHGNELADHQHANGPNGCTICRKPPPTHGYQCGDPQCPICATRR